MLGSPERGFHVPGETKKKKDSNRIITCLHDSSDKCVLAQMGVCQFVNAFLCYLRGSKIIHRYKFDDF